MPTDIRVGGAFVTLNAQSGAYVAGVGAASAANRRLIASYGGFNAALAVSNRAFGRLSASISSSLIATLGYAAGVGLVASSLRSVFTGFLDYDQALIRISKTTGIANVELERLGGNLAGIGTQRFRGRRPLDISRADIFNIAAAAGQAGVVDPREIRELTRAAGALQSSSDLIGSAAVRALTRYLQVTNQGIDRTNAIASAFTHLGNNVVGTEAEISRFSVRVAQNLSAVGQASDAVILGISATLLEAGVEMEAAGSALQRAQLGILRQAADPSAFRFIAQVAGESVDEFEALRQRFVNGTASAEDYDAALLALLRTYRRLPDVATDALPGRPQFLAAFVGGGEQNVRNTRVLAALANREERLSRNIALANEGIEDQNQHFIEAARASEAYRARLEVVGRQIEEFGTNLGGRVVPPVVALAENLDILGTVALAATSALATGFGTRRVRAIREAARETQRAARAEVAAARTAASAARQRQDTTRRQIVGAQRVTQASRQIERQQRALAGTYIATERAQRRLTVAQTHAARVQRNFAQLGRPALQRAGIGVTAAQAEVDRQLRRQAAAQRQLVGTQAVVAGGRPQDTRQLLRGLRRYEQRANATRVAVQRLATTQAHLATVTRTVGQRFLGLGRGLFNFFGGPLGLVIGGLAALPLILSQVTDEVEDQDDAWDDLGHSIRTALIEAEQADRGETAQGSLLRIARESLAGRRLEQQSAIGQIRELARQIFEDNVRRSIDLGASPESFNRARRILNDALRSLSGDVLALPPTARDFFDSLGLADQFDALLEGAAAIRERADEVSDLAESMGAVGDEAQSTGTVLGQTFEALPPSILRAQEAIDSFNRSLDQTNLDALRGARLELSLAGIGPAEASFARLVETERRRLVAFQQQADVGADNATAAREEAEDRLEALNAQRDLIAIGTEARGEAEAAITAAERELRTLVEREAVALRLQELARDRLVDEERLAEIARARRQTDLAQFDEETRRQVRAVRPDFAEPELEGLQRQIAIRNEIDDIQRRQAQTAQVLASATRAEAAAIAAANESLNEYRDELRGIQQQLEVNQRAQELAAEEVVQLEQALATATDSEVDALNERLRAAQLNVAQLMAEGAEIQRLVAIKAMQVDAEREVAEARAAAAVGSEQGPFDRLIQSTADLNDALENTAAQGISRFSDELASAVATGESSFDSLADSILQDLLRIFIQATIVNNLISGLGLGALGGGGGGLGALFGNIFHEGGRTEDGGRRRQLRSGLRSDELFAILQKGELVVPRHLAGNLLSGNFDALRGWLARLPRFHEGGVAGGGHLPREDIVRLTAAIQQLATVVQQLQTVVGRLGGEPLQVAGAPQGAQAISPPSGLAVSPSAAGLPRGAQLVTAPESGLPVRLSDPDRSVLERVEEGINAVHERLGLPPVEGEQEQNILRNQEELVRELREQRRFAEPRATEEPAFREQRTLDPSQFDDFRERFPALIRELERQLEASRAADATFQQMGFPSSPGGTTGITLPGGGRAVLIPGEGILLPPEILNRYLPAPEPPAVRRSREAIGRVEPPPDITAGEGFFIDEDAVRQLRQERELWANIIREFPQSYVEEWQRVFEESLEAAGRPLPRPIGMGAPDRDGIRDIFEFQRIGGIGDRRVGDTPRPDLFPEDQEGIIRFRQQSTAAFGESAEALTNTFGVAGVAGQVLSGDTAGLLQNVFGTGGLLGQLLNSAFSQIGGGGFGGILGSLFGFHEGSSDVGTGARRYPRPAGLRSDELLAVLQKGEIVLPRALSQRVRDGGYQSMDELRMWITRLPRFHEGGHVGGGGGGGLGGAPTRIELINTTSTPIEAVDNGQRVDAGDRIQSFILRDIRRRGPITQGMRLALR